MDHEYRRVKGEVERTGMRRYTRILSGVSRKMSVAAIYALRLALWTGESRGNNGSDMWRPQTSFQRLQGDIYGMISDAKTLLLGVASFADFVPKGRLTRKLTHTVNRAAPMQAFMGAVPIVVGGPLRELFADVGRFGVGSVPELLQYGSLHTLHFAIQVWGARRYWSKPDGFVHQSTLNFLGEELSAPVSLNPLD